MSRRERDVLKVIAQVRDQKCSGVEAARLLGLSDRQVRRIVRRVEAQGDAGVVHKLRGRSSNHAAAATVKDLALKLVHQKYAGFGPTLAWEKLQEHDKLKGLFCVQSLRRWMMAAGQWSERRKRDRHRMRRPRRDCFGEMVLAKGKPCAADVSEHAWLEDRGPRLTLIGMIDDATDRIELRFALREDMGAYMAVLETWLRKHGRPLSWYSDRHSVFYARGNLPGGDHVEEVNTQFARALNQLDIRLIPASSPQAKGRVERLRNTAQDRLVKELRLEKASTMKDAQPVLERFEDWFNKACTNVPASATDAHRSIAGLDVTSILSEQHERVVMNDYTISFEAMVYQLLPPPWPGLRGGTVVIERRPDDPAALRIRLGTRYLQWKLLRESTRRDQASKSLAKARETLLASRASRTLAR